MSRTHAVVDGYYEARDDFDQAPVQATTIADHEGQPATEEGDRGSGAENEVTGDPPAVLQMPVTARCGEQSDRRYREPAAISSAPSTHGGRPRAKPNAERTTTATKMLSVCMASGGSTGLLKMSSWFSETTTKISRPRRPRPRRSS